MNATKKKKTKINIEIESKEEKKIQTVNERVSSTTKRQQQIAAGTRTNDRRKSANSIKMNWERKKTTTTKLLNKVEK